MFIRLLSPIVTFLLSRQPSCLHGQATNAFDRPPHANSSWCQDCPKEPPYQAELGQLVEKLSVASPAGTNISLQARALSNSLLSALERTRPMAAATTTLTSMFHREHERRLNAPLPCSAQFSQFAHTHKPSLMSCLQSHSSTLASSRKDLQPF